MLAIGIGVYGDLKGDSLDIQYRVGDRTRGHPDAPHRPGAEGSPSARLTRPSRQSPARRPPVVGEASGAHRQREPEGLAHRPAHRAWRRSPGGTWSGRGWPGTAADDLHDLRLGRDVRLGRAVERPGARRAPPAGAAAASSADSSDHRLSPRPDDAVAAGAQADDEVARQPAGAVDPGHAHDRAAPRAARARLGRQRGARRGPAASGRRRRRRRPGSRGRRRRGRVESITTGRSPASARRARAPAAAGAGPPPGGAAAHRGVQARAGRGGRRPRRRPPRAPTRPGWPGRCRAAPPRRPRTARAAAGVRAVASTRTPSARSRATSARPTRPVAPVTSATLMRPLSPRRRRGGS